MISLITYLIVRMIKKKRKKNEVPEDILKQFEELERRLKDSNGTKTGQQVLWEMYNKEKVNPIIKEEYKPSISSVKNNKLNSLFKRR